MPKCEIDGQELINQLDANHRPVVVHGFSTKQTFIMLGVMFISGALFMLMVLK